MKLNNRQIEVFKQLLTAEIDKYIHSIRTKDFVSDEEFNEMMRDQVELETMLVLLNRPLFTLIKGD